MARRRRPAQPAPPFSADALRRIERHGLARQGFGDIFHTLMTIRLSALLGVMVGALVVTNLIFGLIFWLIGGLAGARPGHFGDDVFFSVQTFSTTGYGAIYPKSLAANIAASIEILFGLLATALATGLIFARLSRPRARVMFSRPAVIAPRNGVPTLMFRVANQRRNQITNAQIAVTATRDETDQEGQMLRRLIELPLERDRSPAFTLSWTIMHQIDETSPLFGLDTAAMAQDNMVLLCVLTGIDDTLMATVGARHVYGPDDIRFGQRFADIFDRHEDGSFAIDYTRFHETFE